MNVFKKLDCISLQLLKQINLSVIATTSFCRPIKSLQSPAKIKVSVTAPDEDISQQTNKERNEYKANEY